MRKGITITSLVIYVVMFFGLTILATSVTTNFNRNILQEKAIIEINENLIKIQSNLLISSKNSTFITSNNNIITFSNGDIYSFDESKKTLLKNNGVLCENVNSFKVIENSKITENNIDDIKFVATEISFEKFDVTETRNIFVSAGDEGYE